jgi:hypothetical protein
MWIVSVFKKLSGQSLLTESWQGSVGVVCLSGVGCQACGHSGGMLMGVNGELVEVNATFSGEGFQGMSLVGLQDKFQWQAGSCSMYMGQCKMIRN